MVDQKWWMRYRSHVLSHEPPPGPIDNSGMFDPNHVPTAAKVGDNGDSVTMTEVTEGIGNGVVEAHDSGNGTATTHATNGHANGPSNGHASHDSALPNGGPQTALTPSFPLGSEPFLKTTLERQEGTSYQLVPKVLHDKLKSRYGALNEFPRRVVRDVMLDQDVIEAVGWRVKWMFKEVEGELVVSKVSRGKRGEGVGVVWDGWSDVDIHNMFSRHNNNKHREDEGEVRQLYA